MRARRSRAVVLAVSALAVLPGCGAGAERPSADRPATPATPSASAVVDEPEPTRTEQYLAGVAPGYPDGPATWMDGSVAVTDFIADPAGVSTVLGPDLRPLDLSAVNLPDLTFAISDGVLAMGGDARNTLAWQAVRGREIVFSIPYTPYNGYVFGARYAIVTPESGSTCGGAVYDLTTGRPNGVQLPDDVCVEVVSGHHGLLADESHGMPANAVDLRTGAVVPTPRVAEVAGGTLSYDYDGTSWAVPLAAADRVSYGFDRVVYQVGDEIVVLDSADGAEVERWSAAQLTHRENCILLGPLGADHTLLTCGRSNVSAETVSVGSRPAAA